MGMIQRQQPIFRPSYSASGGGGGGQSGGNAAFGWSTTETLDDDVLLTITTNTHNFGTAPTKLFAKWDGGNIGDVISTSNTDFWHVFAHGPKIVADSDTATGRAVELFGNNGGTYEARIASDQFPFPVTEMFLSIAYKVPAGKYFPGATTVQTFPSGSSCKEYWLFKLPYTDNNQTADNDLVLMNHAQGNGNFLLEGNDITSLVPDLANASTWWEWDIYNIKTHWVKANAADPSGSNGQHYIAVSNGTQAAYQYADNSRPTFRFSDFSTPHEWNYGHLAGWIASGGSEFANVQLQVGFAYRAYGPNAAARVEITDNATYNSSSLIVVQPDTSWSSTQIVVRINKFTFASLSGKTLWFTAADNSTRYSAAL
jgi:hypothetical protein